MNYSESGYSLSDIAAATGRNSNDGFGDGNGWWIIIFLIFALGGWGRNGFGGGFGGNGGGGIADNYVLATDFATIERKLDSISNGICDSTFALNNTVVNGFSGVQNALCQGFNGLNVAYLQGTNSLSSQLANCCCDIRQQISDCCCTTQRGLDAVNYNMAINTNGIQQTLCNNTRDIIENQNANYRALHDEIIANRIEDKNAQIAAQQNEINALRLAASQERQNTYLINELKPCPVPAYITCNPYQSYNYGNCGCGCGCN
jgi:hypothetical protein